MIQAIFSGETQAIARKLLDASVLRHEALAANIANAETPGYRRVDLAPDFASNLKAAAMRGDRVDSARASIVEDASAKAVRPDGNNVELEKEIILLSRNSTEHAFLTQIVSSNLRSLRVAISGRVSP